jgi:hypothetical protein
LKFQASASVAAVARASESGAVLDSAELARHQASLAIYVLSSDKQLKECDIPELQVGAAEPTHVPLSSLCVTQAQHLMLCGSGGDAVALAATAAATATQAAAQAGGANTGLSSARGGGNGMPLQRPSVALGSSSALLPPPVGKPGTLRAYAFPPTAEYVEFSCLAGPVVKLCLTPDDRHAIAADASGTLVVLQVRAEKKKSAPGGSSGGGSGGPPGATAWSTELLVTAADLAEKSATAAELAAKVDELQLHNEYQLRLRDMSQGEKAKEIQEKFTQDVEQVNLVARLGPRASTSSNFLNGTQKNMMEIALEKTRVCCRRCATVL